MCVIFSCRCVCWIDGGTFTTCGYRIAGIPLGRYCNCRRFWSSPRIRVVKFNYRFSRHYISLMSHWRTNARPPIFALCMFPVCSLRRSQKHLRFHPIIVVQTSNFIYIYIYKLEKGGGHSKAWQSMLPVWGTLLCLRVPHLWKYWWWQIKWLLLKKKKKKRN